MLSKQTCRNLILAVILHTAFFSVSTAQQGKRIQWTVGDTVREAMVYIPASAASKPVPVVFAFHGHGGTMQNAFNKYRLPELWPEAVFICPQGLNTPGALTDPRGEKSGWQQDKGFQQDRDLIFFDTMMNYLRRNYLLDEKRIYVTGHSNGGSFTYLLWAQRGDLFAAVGPTASIARHPEQFKPKPCFIMIGEKDELVNPQRQLLSLQRILKIDNCGVPESQADKLITYYKCPQGNDVMEYLHPGGHIFPKGTEEALVKFFKEHPAR
jgi:polyhydroxybutyrate depolymerase